MMRRHCTILIALILCNDISPVVAEDTWRGVHRIVAIGDLHGDYDQYRRVMQMTGLIDESGDWAGGKTHLVQTGDIPDRGPDSMKILDELRGLQRRASRAKGYIHLLIGNHEAMNIYGDLRYVHPGEYEALVTARSGRLQKRYYQRFVQAMAESDPSMVFDDEFKNSWHTRFPLGYVEHRATWQPQGEMAKWISTHNAVIMVNDVLFAHGGLSPHQPLVSLSSINASIRRDLKRTDPAIDSPVQDEEGALWYRGYAEHSSEQELEPLARLLDHYGARHIVVGHSPTRGFINSRFDGRAIFIDVGISSHYGSGMAALVIEGDNWFALHRGNKIPLAMEDEDQLAYYRKLGKVEPNPEHLNRVIDKLIAAEAAGP